MENDQIFAADATIDPSSTTQARHLNRSAHRGHDAVIKIGGSIEAPNSIDVEDTPLLSRNIDEDDERHSEDAGSEHGGEHSDWSGARDFEGRPWWNRPSVGPKISHHSLQGGRGKTLY